MKKFKTLICALVLICFSTALYAANSDIIIDETVLEPKDPILATVIAIGPGLLAHGFGHFMCEDYKMGLTLFSLELISLVAIGVGAAEYAAPAGFTSLNGNLPEVQRAGAISMTVGVSLFVITWLVDITLAGSAAEQYNKEHNLEFKMQQESMGLGSEYALLYKVNF
jgi:hypothetical protein